MQITETKITLYHMRQQRDNAVREVVLELQPAIDVLGRIAPRTDDPQEATRLLNELRSLHDAMSGPRWPWECSRRLRSAVIELRYVRVPDERPEKGDDMYNITTWLTAALVAAEAAVSIARIIKDAEGTFGEPEAGNSPASDNT